VVLCCCPKRGVKGSGAVAKMRHTAAAAIIVAGMANVTAAAVKHVVVAADVVEAG